MENLIENPFKKTDEDGEEKKKRPIIKSAMDLQRLKLEKLMKNPDKPIIIPEQPREKDYMQTVPSFVRNVMGSSAGAGSGEFHVYRHLRRKEYARQKCIQAKSIREQLDEEYQMKLEKNRLEAETKTAKKRAKRLKKKQRAKKPRTKQNEQKEDDNDEPTSEEEEDDEDAKEHEKATVEASVNEDSSEKVHPDNGDTEVPAPSKEDVNTAPVEEKVSVDGEEGETIKAGEEKIDENKKSVEADTEEDNKMSVEQAPEKESATDVGTEQSGSLCDTSTESTSVKPEEANEENQPK